MIMLKSISLHRPSNTDYAALCIADNSYEALTQLALDFLHPDEYAYFASLAHHNRKHTYLLGRYCAKQALTIEPFALVPKQYAIMSGIFGQPIISAHTHAQVSIAHTSILGAALAFPEAQPMGIDIELIDNKNRDVIEKEMTHDELALIAKYITDKAYAATLLWTAKEALAKIMRTGLMTPFQLFEISSCTLEGEYVYTQFKHFHQYQACSFPIEQHMCSIVYPRETKLRFD